jgi:hypothetical protein
MIFYDVPHGSPEWYDLRIGVATASAFSKLITPTGKKSSQIKDYSDLLIAEILKNQSLDKFKPTYWMERGIQLEADAAKLYEFETGYTLDAGGFITTDNGRAGCSVDRRVFDETGNAIGGLEIKCPAPWTHIGNLLRNGVDEDYIPQVQGQMSIGGFQWIDFVSFDDILAPLIVRVNRDEKFIATLNEALDDLETMIDEKFNKLIKSGHLRVKPDLSQPKIIKRNNAQPTQSAEYLRAG